MLYGKVFEINRENNYWFPTIDYKKGTAYFSCTKKSTHNVYEKTDEQPLVTNTINYVDGFISFRNLISGKKISLSQKGYLKKLSKNKNFNMVCNYGEN